MIAREVLDTVLEDDGTPFAGVSFLGETVKDFCDECELPYDIDLIELNRELRVCGIKPLEIPGTTYSIASDLPDYDELMEISEQAAIAFGAEYVGAVIVEVVSAKEDKMGTSITPDNYVGGWNEKYSPTDLIFYIAACEAFDNGTDFEDAAWAAVDCVY